MSNHRRPQSEHLHHTREVRQPKAKVLIVGHADGFIEAYSRDPVDIHYETMPDMRDVEGEIVGQDYLEVTLPPTYRPLFMPGLIRCSGLIRSVRPGRLAERRLSLDLIHAVDRLGRDEETVRWVL